MISRRRIISTICSGWGRIYELKRNGRVVASNGTTAERSQISVALCLRPDDPGSAQVYLSQSGGQINGPRISLKFKMLMSDWLDNLPCFRLG